MPKTDPTPEQEFAKVLNRHPLPLYVEDIATIGTCIWDTHGKIMLSIVPVPIADFFVHRVNAYPGHVAELAEKDAEIERLRVIVKDNDDRHFELGRQLNAEMKGQGDYIALLSAVAVAAPKVLGQMDNCHYTEDVTGTEDYDDLLDTLGKLKARGEGDGS